MLDRKDPDRPEKPENPLTETTTVVKTPAQYGLEARSQTFGVRWRTTNARTGRIAAYAVFDEHTGDTAAGPIFDPDERQRLARRLCESLPVWDDDMHTAIVACLNTVARTLLEHVVA